jgi:serine/threonine protein kinase
VISVSPTHQIELDESLLSLLEQPPDRDYVIRQLSQKVVNGQPLIQGDLVVAGEETRNEYPLAQTYPVHFRKTYYPICFHQDPGREYANHLAASRIIDVPPPIGSTRTTFRSCFLPGVPFDRLSSFGVEPEDRNIQIATETEPAAAIGLWYLLTDIFAQVTKLHAGGLVHGDLFLHNVIVSPTPLGVHLIDFEQAVLRDDVMAEGEWEQKQEADLVEIFKLAVFLQCTLGQQQGALAEQSVDAVGKIFGDGDRFLRAIARRSSWD